MGEVYTTSRNRVSLPFPFYFPLVKGRVRETPSARQQCWPESFCKSEKFLRHVHYWPKNFRIIWKFSGCYIKIICKVSGWSGKCLDDLKSVCMIWKVSGQLAETSSGSKIRRPLGTLPPPFGEKEAQYDLKCQNLLVLYINDYEVTSWHDACHEARYCGFSVSQLVSRHPPDVVLQWWTGRILWSKFLDLRSQFWILKK